jgi:hypothetical protein
MNAKSVTSAVLVAWCWVAGAFAQDYPGPAIGPPPIRKDLSGRAELVPPPEDAQPPSTGLSEWITGKRGDCCTSAGPPTPIEGELFVRSGVSIPVGGNYLGRNLQVGWTIEVGVRGLLFNSEMTRAWVAEVHIVNSNDSGISNADPVTLNIFQPNAAGTSTQSNVAVTPNHYNRTLGGLGFGRDWYLWGAANAPGNKLRWGLDAGGRYGSGDMTYNEIRHRTDTLGGIYAALHAELEVPCGHCYLSWGLRSEWAYTWGDILQKQSDVQELNLLAVFSVRY